jgi:hypothetical protein
VELALWVAHVDLHERTGQFLHFPRRRFLARAKPHDHVAGANRLARLELELARNSVALVEQPKHRHPLRHRRRARRNRGHRLRDIDGFRLRVVLRVTAAGRAGAAILAAPGQSKQQQRAGAGAKAEAAHPPSGVHAS